MIFQLKNWRLRFFKSLTCRLLFQLFVYRNNKENTTAPCTVYPKKYAHGFCFAVLCCGYTLTDFPISIRFTSLALWQSNDCPSASKATLMNMDKYFMWIHYERLHNHNKAKHNKTVCIFLGIYCMVGPLWGGIHWWLVNSFIKVLQNWYQASQLWNIFVQSRGKQHWNPPYALCQISSVQYYLVCTISSLHSPGSPYTNIIQGKH